MEKILDLQTQSSLAKLLATENITVTHSKTLSTAYFDVKNRVLGLPVWKDKGKVVYDMLVGHEVAHALYTDHAEFEKFIEEEGRGNFDILNIIEDIRIERLIKIKYAGMPRIFNGAYKQLVNDDFFGTADKDITALSFLDRLNLRAKIGPHTDIPLDSIEEDIFNRCVQAETFQDVVELYHEVKKHLNDKKKEQQPQEEDEESNQSPEEEQSEGDSGESDDNASLTSESQDDSASDDVQDDGEESHSQESESTEEGDDSAQVSESLISDQESDSAMPSASEGASGKSDSKGEDIDLTNESETMRAFDENLTEKQDVDSYGRRPQANKTEICLWPTKTTIEKHIIPYKTVLSQRSDCRGDSESVDNEYHDFVNNKSIEFKKNLNKKVGVLVREFERRKASYQYSRAQESRRGSLDVNNLHKYKYDDQIFETTMRLADAKSHGMIFFIDYSGSMSHVLKDVLEHTLNLVHFCKKVGIPFEVYSFTSNYALDSSDTTQSNYEFDMTNLVLATLFSSDMSKSDYKIAFDQVVRQISSSYDSSFSQAGISPFENLGGTPLDSSLIAAQHIVKKFNRKHGVQKTNVIFLSDGDSHSCFPQEFRYRTPQYVTVVDGKQYTIPQRGATAVLTKMLGDITGATTVGWYLPSNSGTALSHIRKMAFSAVNELHNSSTTKKWIKQYRKEGFYNASNCFGYDSYFLLNSDIKISDSEFDYSAKSDKSLSDSRVEQSKLAREFAKHNVKNRQNRIIMTKFAEIIA